MEIMGKTEKVQIKKSKVIRKISKKGEPVQVHYTQREMGERLHTKARQDLS